MATITISVKKLGMTFDFDTATLPESSQAYVWEYGLTQSINDAHASIMRKNFETDEAYLAAAGDKVAKRVEQIRSGNVPGSRAPADPNAATARKLAKAMDEQTKTALEAILADPAKLAKLMAAAQKMAA